MQSLNKLRYFPLRLSIQFLSHTSMSSLEENQAHCILFVRSKSIGIEYLGCISAAQFEDY